MRSLFVFLFVFFVGCYMLTRDAEFEMHSVQLMSIKTLSRGDKPYYELLWQVDDKFSIYTYAYDTVFSVGQRVPALIKR